MVFESFQEELSFDMLGISLKKSSEVSVYPIARVLKTYRQIVAIKFIIRLMISIDRMYMCDCVVLLC